MWYDEWEPLEWGRIGAVGGTAALPITVGAAVLLDTDNGNLIGGALVLSGVLFFLWGTAAEIQHLWRLIRESNASRFFQLAWPMGGFQPSKQQGQADDGRGLDIPEDVKPGLFDYLRDADRASNEVVRLATRITETTESYAEMLQQRSADLQRINSQGLDAVEEADQILSETAAEVVQYADDMREFEGPLGESIEEALEAYSKAAAIQDEDFGGNVEEFVQAKQETEDFQIALSEAAQAVDGHKQAIDGWPRITREINYARMQASKTLERLRSRLSRAGAQAEDVVEQFDLIIERKRSSA